MSKTILVTGGAGFLGRHLCGKLLENKQNKVICLDNYITGTYDNIKEFINNENFTFYEHDITIPLDFIVVDQLDEIYHLACIASPDKYKIFSIETLNTSFIGTQNVLQLAKKYNKCKYSGSVYLDADVMVGFEGEWEKYMIEELPSWVKDDIEDKILNNIEQFLPMVCVDLTFN